MSYEVRDENHLQQIIASISALKGKEVEIGIFGNDGEKPVPGAKITMVRLAQILHEGCRIKVTPKMRWWLASHGLWLKRETNAIVIPPRPFIDPVMQDAEEKVVAILESALTDACEARPVSGTATYERVGLTIKGLVQAYMLKLKNPPNHPFTIAMKGSSKPLVDHGNLVGAIVHEVRDKGLVPAGSSG